ncbi:quinone-dependent dihydroorotate dehydrogenase [Candidatus Dojkabacteria bacterium]|jgi:dihydroorotate dehydrogenase subfamily 2|nr:quinone-dependent dihydroorotate dehydrogenase [Candidatus Dojkabacteria bacterium]
MFRFLYKTIFKPFFFLFPAEFTHDFILVVGKLLGRFKLTRRIVGRFSHRSKMLTQEVKGITFVNPVGLAAGFDKDASLIGILPSVGFSFEEMGSITLNPYKGNKKPRLWRLKKSKGLMVNSGLKNLGVDKEIERIKKYKIEKDFVLGISIAKTNSKVNVDIYKAIEDYYKTIKKLEEENIGSYYTINISCPNAFGGEPFTTPKRLELLLKKMGELNIEKPMFLKMPINLPWSDFDNLLKIAIINNITGVIIGNLNKDRGGLKDRLRKKMIGGISGKHCEKLSNELISKTYRKYRNKLVIIGVGGIFKAQDVYEKIKRGATLVQLITGMIYEGPQLIGEINKGLEQLLIKDGYKNIKDAIGKDIN